MCWLVGGEGANGLSVWWLACADCQLDVLWEGFRNIFGGCLPGLVIG